MESSFCFTSTIIKAGVEENCCCQARRTQKLLITTAPSLFCCASTCTDFLLLWYELRFSNGYPHYKLYDIKSPVAPFTATPMLQSHDTKINMSKKTCKWLKTMYRETGPSPFTKEQIQTTNLSFENHWNLEQRNIYFSDAKPKHGLTHSLTRVYARRCFRI